MNEKKSDKYYFSNALLHWYKKNKRDLPWRNTENPYFIWLSEIILQQTRVAQGLPYYLNFVSKYPDIQSFASAPSDDIMRMWQGLGYYSRARNMQETAKIIVEKLNSKFPTNFTELIELKGIGPYTAAAIASFSANEAVAVVDGNVFRVLSRIFGIETDIASHSGKKQFQELATSLLPPDKSSDYNQAIMQLGALVCLPKKPHCLECPVASSCVAYFEGKPDKYPVKSKKLIIKTRFLYYLIPETTTTTTPVFYLKKRAEGDVWQGLYDFPLIESKVALTTSELIASILNLLLPNDLATNTLTYQSAINGISSQIKHQLTHQRLNVSFIKLNKIILPDFEIWCSKNGYLAYEMEATEALPKPILIANFLSKKSEINNLTILFN